MSGVIVAQREGVRVVGIRKCGHTSIINTFMAQANDDGNSLSPTVPGTPAVVNSMDQAKKVGGYRGMLENAIEDNWPDPHTVITFIRNPIHRAMSAYQHFLVRSERPYLIDLGFEFGCSFQEYVDHLLKVDLDADPHITPFFDKPLKAGTKHCKYILAPLELIDQCWPAIFDALGFDDIPRTVLHKNKGGYKQANMLEFYEVLAELYSKDYRLWRTIYDETRASLPSINYKTSEELICLANQ